MQPKKHALTLLMAMGPKSQTSSGSGASTTSIASPDQSGDAMAPGGSDEMAPDATETASGASDAQEEGEDMLDMPKGFKPPSSAADGGMFTTTIRACVVDGKLKVLAVGDMPLKGGEEMGGGDDDSAAYVKRKKDSKAAQMAFQPNR